MTKMLNFSFASPAGIADSEELEIPEEVLPVPGGVHPAPEIKKF